MSWQCSKQRSSRRPWPLLGLLIVVLFVGHDMLMASEAGAAPRHQTPVSRHVTDPHVLMGSMSPSDSSAPVPAHPGHPQNCRIGQCAVPPDADGEHVDPGHQGRLAAIAFTLTRTSAGDDHHLFAWGEPSWPPGTLRALFQVYRI